MESSLSILSIEAEGEDPFESLLPSCKGDDFPFHKMHDSVSVSVLRNI